MLRPLVIALAAAIALPAYVGPVSATDYWDWDIGSGSPTSRAKHAHRKFARRHSHSDVAHRDDGTKVMGYVRRDGDRETIFIDRERGEFHCAEKVRGLGTQWIGTEGGLDAAKKDRMERVRYDYGESFLDMSNSKDFVSRCGRTSIGETMGQVMYRCEIVARPCKGQMQESKATTK